MRPDLYRDDLWFPLSADEHDYLFGTLVDQNLLGSDLGIFTSPDTAEARWRPLPFYDRAKLVRLTNKAVPYRWQTTWFLALGNQFWLLDGQSDPIHQVNDAAPITLTFWNVLAYVKFFVDFLLCDGKPFRIVETIADLGLKPTDDLHLLKRIADALTPSDVMREAAPRQFVVEAILLYNAQLFRCVITVAPNGNVVMRDDAPLGIEIPRGLVKGGPWMTGPIADIL